VFSRPDGLAKHLRNQVCQHTTSRTKQKTETETNAVPLDLHNSLCQACGGIGDLLCCDFCNLVYHTHCLSPPLIDIPEGKWACPMCSKEKQEQEKQQVPDVRLVPGTNSLKRKNVADVTGSDVTHQINNKRQKIQGGVKDSDDASVSSSLSSLPSSSSSSSSSSSAMSGHPSDDDVESDIILEDVGKLHAVEHVDGMDIEEF